MAKYEKKEAKKVDVKPERLHGSLRGEYEEALQGAPKKKNVGKALSDKSLEDLQNGRVALQENITKLQSVLDVVTSEEDRRAYGTQLEANFKLLDRIEKEIGVKEMDEKEDMSLDGEPSPYDEEALKKALATGGKVEAPDWVIDALLEELPPAVVETGALNWRGLRDDMKIVSSPEGGETPTEAAESWGKIRSEGSAASDEAYELRDRIYQANRNLESRWGLELGMYGRAEAILGVADKGLVTLDPEFEKDLRGSLTLKKQRDLAESKTRELYKSGRGGYAGMVGREAVEEEFPEAKKKAE
jgi:hypothetical protein